MTTNRMGLEQTLSDGELTVITDTDHVQCGDAAAMARELLAYRKASKEAYGYVHKSLYEKGCSVGLSGDHEAYQDSSTHIPLYAAPPLQAVTVPDGWQLMPTELTSVMRNAWDSAPNGDDDNLNMQNAYRAMIAAAPKSVTNEP